MAINKYFKSFQKPNEQLLLSKLIAESISIFGVNCYYLPRTINNLNNILGEDPTSSFDAAYEIESYLENVDGFEGDKNFLSIHGLHIAKSSNFLVSDYRFKQVLSKGPFNIPPPSINLNVVETLRPKEGDLFYVPLTKGLFEIKFADHEAVFYQLGKTYVWRLTVEMFKYSNEIINTGILEIDQITTNYTNNNSIVNDPLADNNFLQDSLDTFIFMEAFNDDAFAGGAFN